MKLVDVTVDEGTPKGRSAWTFNYRAAELQEASERQAAYHREREAYYKEQAEALEVKLREGGIELREQNVTGGPRFAAAVDPEIAEELHQARMRRDAHATKAKRFDAYVGSFGAVGTTVSYQLTIEDVDYFALHREPGD